MGDGAWYQALKPQGQMSGGTTSLVKWTAHAEKALVRIEDKHENVCDTDDVYI
jgi:hypothetical protein